MKLNVVQFLSKNKILFKKLYCFIFLPNVFLLRGVVPLFKNLKLGGGGGGGGV